MLYHLLVPLAGDISVMNVFKYITMRTALAALTAMVISLALGPWLIEMLRRFQIAQFVRDEGPKSHAKKEGTPTMGGVLILVSILVPCLLWMNMANRFVWLAIGATVLYAAIGFYDDFRKVAHKRNLGLSARGKLVAQILAAVVVGGVLYFWSIEPAAGEPRLPASVPEAEAPRYSTQMQVPFFKKWTPDLGFWYVPFVVLVLVSACNAVNLTDGLDGLAIGATLICMATYAVLTYAAGHAKAATYLGIFHVEGIGEVTVFCGAMVGASMGFLWFNCHPAKVFMGDVGSLAIGGAIGTVAVLIKQELLLMIVGGLFVLEAVSVVLQVAYFRATGGKRIFRMSPLHHHFELCGWHESTVIVRFWILAVVFALLGLSTLKLR